MVKTDIDTLVRQYASGVRKMQRNPPRRGLLRIIGRVSPELAGLNAGMVENIELAQQLIDQQEPRKVINAARKLKNHYETGLAIGYLFPRETLEETADTEENDFNRGLKKGQLYKLKVNTKRLRERVSKSVLTLAGGYAFYLYTSPYVFKPENRELAEKIVDCSQTTFWGGLIYGMMPMVVHKLLCNDLSPSNSLITSGQFAMHRNPLYTGMMVAGATALTKMAAVCYFAENPNWLATGIAALGFGFLCKSFNDYVKEDERILEKQFGQEYRDYKSRTNRFIPNPLNLFKRKK